ncbi:MAG: PHP domain-containing protein [Prochlorothrix sp.]
MTVAFPQPRSPQPTPAAQDLAAVFATIDRHSCPTHYNFHLHTLRSDGQMHPRGLLQQAIAHGLTGLAITDHHTLAGYREAQQYRQDLQQDPQQDPQDDALVTPRALPSLWSGVEITAKLAGITVHILGYGFNVDAPELVPYTGGAEVHPSGQPFQAAEVIAALQAAGGLAVLAHPVRYRKPPEVLIPAAAKLGIDGVETFYAYDNPVPWRPSVAQTERVQQLGSSYGLFQTCGTDSHGPTLLQRL